MDVSYGSEDLLIDRPAAFDSMFVFAHGAGAPADSDWMGAVTALLVERGLGVVRFEFPYMRARRTGGAKKPPDRAATLLASWRAVIPLVRELAPAATLFIGGKSLGGRQASLIADESEVAGLICLGFPFHASGRELGDRAAHLATITTPTLILQGERDALGSRAELADFHFSPQVTLHFLADGDHSLKPRARSGRTLAANLAEAADQLVRFTEQRR